VKQSVGDLAMFGGQPVFAEPLHVGRPTLGNRARLLERINEVLDRRWFTNNGPCVNELERRIEGLLGVKHVVATCNGTVALELAIRACGLKGEVIVPAFTFIATAHALQWQGIRPVFCDIDERSFTLDPQSAEQAITPQTTGIIGVHLWGRSCEVEALSAVARSHDLTLLFDAAHAFGGSHRGRPIGTFGRAEVFSFHATKFVSTFEGGAVVTDDGELAARIRLMKNFGFAGYDDVVYVGTNGKMSEISAAMGLTSLESMHEFLDANRRIREVYREGLAAVSGIQIVESDEGGNEQYAIVEIDLKSLGMSRDELQQILWAENVLARRYFYPGCHRMEPYRSLVPPEHWHLPVTERVAARVLSLPTGSAVTVDDVRQVCELIQFAAGHAGEIAGRMAAASIATVDVPLAETAHDMRRS
jgi:dTDP-4-amino-4,6-dideoxygalactose transaminase